MESYSVALSMALWLGILTSISPCPLATNIVAITFIGKRVDRPRMVILSGIMYTIGRMVTYTVLGILVVGSLLSIPKTAMFLQQNLNKALGPLLIVVGLFLLGVLRIGTFRGGLSEALTRRVATWGIWGSGLLGMLFALSFCPVSAALFFGSLIPLAVNHESSVIMPSVYGVGTALPVGGLALLIALGTNAMGAVYKKIGTFEKWARRITAITFMGAGCYLTAVYWFNIPW